MIKKFIRPAINIGESRKIYENAAAKWNEKFYKTVYCQKTKKNKKKFIRENSRKLYIQHKEIWIALLIIMNDRLKRRNRSFDLELHNFYLRPFEFDVSTLDIQNMLTKYTPDKQEISRETIKRALYRFSGKEGKNKKEREEYNGPGYILSMNWRRSKSRYDVVLNSSMLNFVETSPKQQNIWGSARKESKHTKCGYYTDLNNNKSNQIDLEYKTDLQANQIDNNSLKKGHREYEKTMPDVMEEKETKIPPETLKSSAGEILPYDPRTLEEKEESFEESIQRIGLLAEENDHNKEEVLKQIPKPKKTRKHLPEKERENSRFNHFKTQTIIEFYMHFLLKFFSTKNFTKYSPYNYKSPYFSFTYQSIEILKESPHYFGNCKTIEEIQNRSFFLYNTLSRSARWLKKRQKQNPGFNTNFWHPNRILSREGQGNFSFIKALDWERKMVKRKPQKVKGEFTKKQFQNLLNRVTVFVTKQNLLRDTGIQNYFNTSIDGDSYKLRAKQADWQTYRFMTQFLYT